MDGMAKTWFGWSGLLGLLLFLSFLVYPNEINLVPYKLASTTLVLAMVASIVFPLIASVRSSKWWLAISVCGLATAVRFFWIIAA
jgi:hypothetical protein